MMIRALLPPPATTAVTVNECRRTCCSYVKRRLLSTTSSMPSLWGDSRGLGRIQGLGHTFRNEETYSAWSVHARTHTDIVRRVD
jgi:hypothetical protein